jgi:hypothetical protein
MNYFISFIFAVAGIAVILYNKSLSQKIGAFYSRRFNRSFGALAQILRVEDPNGPLNRFMYRGFVITTGIIFLIFALAALFGTNFVGPSSMPGQSFLQAQN